MQVLRIRIRTISLDSAPDQHKNLGWIWMQQRPLKTENKFQLRTDILFLRPNFHEYNLKGDAWK